MTGEGARPPRHLRNTGGRVPCGRLTRVLVTGCHNDQRCPQRAGGAARHAGVSPRGARGCRRSHAALLQSAQWVSRSVMTGSDPHTGFPAKRPQPATPLAECPLPSPRPTPPGRFLPRPVGLRLVVSLLSLSAGPQLRRHRAHAGPRPSSSVVCACPPPRAPRPVH